MLCLRRWTAGKAVHRDMTPNTKEKAAVHRLVLLLEGPFIEIPTVLDSHVSHTTSSPVFPTCKDSIHFKHINTAENGRH